MRETKGNWKNSLVILVALLAMTIQACTSAKQRRRNVEIWLLDPEEVALYRRIDGNLEEILPIADNMTLLRFICIDKTTYAEIVEEMLGGDE